MIHVAIVLCGAIASGILALYIMYLLGRYAYKRGHEEIRLSMLMTNSGVLVAIGFYMVGGGILSAIFILRIPQSIWALIAGCYIAGISGWLLLRMYKRTEYLKKMLKNRDEGEVRSKDFDE